MHIPGLEDYYDGLNQHLAAEIERAADEPEPAPADPHHHDHPEADHLAARQDGGPHGEAPHGGSGEHGGMLDLLWPAAVHGAAFGAFKFAAEHLAEAVLSETMLGSATPREAHHAPAPHVGSMDGEGFSHQTTGFTCAVVSQGMILHQFHLIDPQTGEPLSEARLAFDALSHGWLTDHGTSLGDLDKLLGHYGVASHEGHDWAHLVRDLAAGHQVVMAVNADRLWHEHGPASELLNLFGNHANHAVVVRGLKVDDDGRVAVVINDPGRAHGAGVEYPIEHFQSAIESTRMHYVATDHAPPGWSPAPEITALAAHARQATPGSAEEPAAMSDRDRENFLRDI